MYWKLPRFRYFRLLCLDVDIKSSSFQFSGRRTPTPTVTWLSLWVWILRWPSTTITMKWSSPSLTPWCRSSRAWETSKIRIHTVKLTLIGNRTFLFWLYKCAWYLLYSSFLWVREKTAPKIDANDVPQKLKFGFPAQHKKWILTESISELEKVKILYFLAKFSCWIHIECCHPLLSAPLKVSDFHSVAQQENVMM